MRAEPRESQPVRVALVQMACSAEKADNVACAVAGIRRAADQGAQVVCLPELFHGHYPCQSEDYARFAEAEPIPGPTSQTLAAVAAECGVVLVASLFERRAPGLYHNTALVFDADGSTAGLYRKMHIPDDPLYYEKFYFTPGDLGFRRFATRAGPLGVGVCWDQWFPEAARLMALRGAQMLFYPTAIGWMPGDRDTCGPSQHAAWETVMRSHAIANGVFVAAVNRVGREGQLQFWGASFICDPLGVVLTRGTHDDAALLVADCQLDQIDTVRTHWPFLRDRRIDAYEGLLRRYLDE